MNVVLIAMDRAPSRRIDADGHMHVEVSNITKANVCPYYGREIPGHEQLGLDADRVYHLLRHPDELAKAAETFNGKPVLFDHKPTTANDHQHSLTVGATGSNASFDGTYLTNTLSLWAQDAIDGVQSNRKRQLSAGYRYRPDMTPGTFNGVAYDGIMRDVVCNHVALVIEGRAGPDVLVGDESMKLNSRAALMIGGAIGALVRPKLAQDAQVDITPALADVSAKSIAMDGAPKTLAEKIVALVKPHLAQDQDIKAEDVENAIEAVPPTPENEDAIEATNPKPADKPGNTGAGATVTNVEPVAGMDEATVSTMIATATAKVRSDMIAADEARRVVQPFVGDVSGMDSAPAIYKLALDHLKVDLTGVPEAGYGALLKAMPKPNVAPIAQDASAVAGHHGDFTKRFPKAVKLTRSM